jgi:hypothetical protein
MFMFKFSSDAFSGGLLFAGFGVNSSATLSF